MTDYRGRVPVRGLGPLIVAATVGVAVLVPMGYVVRRSLGGGADLLDAYVDVFRETRIVEVLTTTFVVALLGTSVAMVLGTTSAWLIQRTDVPGARILGVAPMLPVFMSPLVMAVGYVFLLDSGAGYVNVALRSLFGLDGRAGPIDIYSRTWVGMILGIYASAYVFPYARAGLASLDGSYEEAARVSGAGRLRVLRTITAPLSRPALVVAAQIAFIITVAEFAIPSTIGSRAGLRIVSTEIYRFARGFPPQPEKAAALSVLITLVSLLGFLPVYRTLRNGSRYEVVGTRGPRSRVALGRWRWPAAGLLLGYVMLAAVLPLAGITIVALQPYWNPDLDGLTLVHFRAVFDDPRSWAAIRNSVVYSMVASTIAVAMAFAIAHWRRYRNSRVARVADFLATVPLAVPGIVFGIGVLFMSLQGPVVFYGTAAALIVAYVAKFIPLSQRALTGGVAQIKADLIEASRVAGARELRTVLRVVGPLTAPTILASWGLMMLVMFREYPASALLFSGDTTVSSVQLYEFFEDRAGGQAGAYALVLLGVGVALVGVLALVLAPLSRWTQGIRRRAPNRRQPSEAPG